MKKRFIAFVLSVMLVLPLSACIGIGDGALFGDSALNSPYKFTLYRSDGSVFGSGGIDADAGENLRIFLSEGDYREVSLDNSISKDYAYFYELSLKTEEGTDVYRVYGNWYVYKKTESGFTHLGRLNQSFERVREAIYGEEYIKYKDNSDYITNEIVLIANIEKEYKVNDFPEVDCICVKNTILVDAGLTMMKLTIDSATDEEFWNSIEKLKAREDISSADPNYPGTLD